MYAHKMIVGENSNFAVEYNLPKQLRGLPLEIIILPMMTNEVPINRNVEEMIALAAFNDMQSLRISPEIDISSIADDVNL
ncbi:MAG: hypothetical protein M0P91_00670 [Sulfuricurvum sp.]|jgi:hypothetical protein|uniref:hypothetical protein n=1 Tax=Sulfuricurvum sp. TaxID=2025608 RepID=UPI0025DF0A4F|nr:hypothetical protein [Sulfuricurvum sp.]MCK9371682.1 hypothetical protein [Sulfuricurvum sp.]